MGESGKSAEVNEGPRDNGDGRGRGEWTERLVLRAQDVGILMGKVKERADGQSRRTCPATIRDSRDDRPFSECSVPLALGEVTVLPCSWLDSL